MENYEIASQLFFCILWAISVEKLRTREYGSRIIVPSLLTESCLGWKLHGRSVDTDSGGGQNYSHLKQKTLITDAKELF